jgi:hypothetical protein
LVSEGGGRCPDEKLMKLVPKRYILGGCFISFSERGGWVRD